jgi:hypothetical protein
MKSDRVSQNHLNQIHYFSEEVCSTFLSPSPSALCRRFAPTARAFLPLTLLSAPLFQIKTQLSASEGSQGSGASSPSPWDSASDYTQRLDTLAPPLDSVLSGGAWQADYEADVTNTLDSSSSSDMSEQDRARSDFTVNSDFSPPPLEAMGDRTQNAFALKNPNLDCRTHPSINGEFPFILDVFVANFVDQESLVNKTAAI